MTQSNASRLLRVFAGILVISLSGWAVADPPLRAARLGYISGVVSFSPSSQPDWVQAAVNRPLTTGDRLWADSNSRAELQIGGASIRLGELTDVTLLNLDDSITQVQLLQGSLNLHVRQLGARQSFEIDTPNLAFTLRLIGDYRVDVDPDGSATAVRVHSGRGEIYGEGASYTVDPNRGYRFYGTDLSDYEALVAQPDDDFDRWARTRDHGENDSPSARYVSPDVIGYQDLDGNGTWREDPNYGYVWTPNRVAAGWTPYRDGHWAWVDPWGWTWVDDAPWGFAVSHYGRWANISGTWVWVPGPVREQAVYAPALVAFVGGNNFRLALSVGGAAAVGWFPLAPRDVYRPPYPVSRSYFDNVNRSNAVIAPAVITNVYNTTVINRSTTVVNNTTNVTNVLYGNQKVNGAIVAVPTQAFVHSQPVARAALPVSIAAAIKAPVIPVAAIVPVQQSVHGGAPPAGARPPHSERAFVARTTPPPPPITFVSQQQQLAARPGAPVDEDQRKRLLPTLPAVAASKVSVVTNVVAPLLTALPPAAPPAGKSHDARKAAAVATVQVTDDAVKAGALKLEAAKANAAKAETARPANARAEAVRADASRGDTAKAETEAARSAKARAEAAQAELARAETHCAATAKADAAHAEAAKTAGARSAVAPSPAPVAQTQQLRPSRTELPQAKPRPPGSKPETEEEKKKEEETHNR